MRTAKTPLSLLVVGLLGALLSATGCGSDARPSGVQANADAGAGSGPGGANGVGFEADAAPTGGQPAGCQGGQPGTKASDITIDAAYASKYTAFDLGEIPGLPNAKYGGIVLKAGDDNTLLVGGNANYAGASVYEVPVIRSACKHIVGFAGPAKKKHAADYIDGGLVYGPGGTLLFAAWPMDETVRQSTNGMLGLIQPGASGPSKSIHGVTLGVAEALAALNFVPTGFPGAGRLKLVTWEGGSFYDATFKLDGSGRVEDVTKADYRLTVPGGPEGFAYVPQGSPLFGPPSMVMSEWSKNGVATYEVASDGDPILATRKTFLTGLSGAEGAFFDPLTGDFVFSTWNTMRPERIVVVLGFAPITAPR